MAQTKMPVAALADLEENDFVEHLKDVYEKSPWVPRRLFAAKRPADFDSTTNLAAAFKRVVQDASSEELHKLMNSYPDLAGRAHVEGKVTEESRDEHVSSHHHLLLLLLLQELARPARRVFLFAPAIPVLGPRSR